MALQTLFLEIYLALLAINGGILMVDSLVDTPLVTPFDTSMNVTGTSQPNIFNGTSNDGTLTGNFTTLDSLTNSTIVPGGSGTLNPFDTLFFPITMLYTFVQFITGGFVFQVLILFGFPEIFVFVLQGLIGTLLAVTIVYYITGR